MKSFVRKQQTFADLQNEPPKSWASFRKILRKEMVDIRASIDQLEVQFYDNSGPMDYLRTFTPIIKEILDKQKETKELNTMRQIENALLTSEMETEEKKLSNEATDKLRHFQLKILSYVPEKFVNLIERCHQLQNHCNKYMRAFFNPKTDPLVEAAKQYSHSISEWKAQVVSCIQHLYTLPKLFLQTGVNLVDLGLEALDILERVGLIQCPVMVMFTDCCEHLRKALGILEHWIDHDELYMDYVKSDLQSADKILEDTDKDLKTFTHTSAMAQFRLRQLQTERNSLNSELMSVLGTKEAELIVDEESAYQEMMSMKAQINKDFHRCQLLQMQKKSSDKKVTKDQHEIESLTVSLRESKRNIQKLKKSQLGIQLKLKVISDKRTELETLNTEIKELNKSLTSVKKKAKLATDGADEAKMVLVKCKEIYGLVSTPDILAKIFYKMPLATPRSTLNRSTGGLTARGGEDIQQLTSPRLNPHQGGNELVLL